MGFQAVLGQELATGQLKSAILQGRVSHAYLFAGPEGTGKALTAGELAKALNCLHPVAGEACQECLSCRKNKAANHPQVHLISPTGSSIKINQIRELKDKVKYKNFDGLYQVVIIDQVETITLQGANSLLKILEEPWPDTVFILLTAQPYRVLPTILSRCQAIKFAGLTPAVLEKILVDRGVELNRAKLAGMLANGSAGAALELSTGEELWEWRETAIALAGLVEAGDILAALRRVDSWLVQKLPVAKLLDLLLFWYRDIIVWKESGSVKLLVNGDKLEQVAGGNLTMPRLLDLAEQVSRCRQELLHNINEGLALETLVGQLAGQGGILW